MAIKTMLIEDNPSDARLIQELLRQAGGGQIVLAHADRMSTALESFDAEQPDVLILDLNLPDSNGIMTFRRVQAKAEAVPIVILTGRDDIGMALETITEGAADYLLKTDLSANLLMRVLRYSIERKRIDYLLRRTENELQFQNEMAAAFLTAPGQEMALGVLRVMLQFMQSQAAAFGYLDPEGALICPATARAGADTTNPLPDSRFPRGSWTGIWGRALLERQPVLWNQPAEELGMAVWRVLAVPLLDRGEVVGLFEVAGKASDYDSADRDFLMHAADYLAPILRVRLQRDAHEKALSTALRAAEVLLRELHHRVKNNLQVVASMLNMQADGLPTETQQALDECQHRVRTLALVHEQLYNRECPDRLDFDQYAASLANDLFAAYSASGSIQLRLALEPVQLGIDQAIPCGLILNELLTNSLKYAFPDGRPGEIAVELQSDGEDRVTLRIADNGIGLPPGLDWRHVESLGLRIVGILTAQLNGALECSAASGVAFTLTFVREHLGTD